MIYVGSPISLVVRHFRMFGGYETPHRMRKGQVREIDGGHIRGLARPLNKRASLSA